MSKPVYLDYASTTPVDPAVADLMRFYMVEEFGNAGSRTHEYGNRAKKAVQNARQQIANIIGCQLDEVIFTSGATESNNIALLGLRHYAQKEGKKHIISTAIEHKAVLEPLEYLEREHGFDVELVKPKQSGAVSAKEILSRVREDTILVSVMHVNNETGIIQPTEEIAEGLKNFDVYFHVDAAQSFCKIIEPLKNQRIDFISVSGHKIYGPKGIGALVTRRRNFRRAPLKALTYGGGQEYGLRPGTLPVSQIVGLGEAAFLCAKRVNKNFEKFNAHQREIYNQLKSFKITPVGDQSIRSPGILSLCVEDQDSEAVILMLKEKFSISNGSACTSSNYTESHVLTAMGLQAANTVIRISF